MAISTQCAGTGNGGAITVSAPLQADNTTADAEAVAFWANAKIVNIEYDEETLERIDCSHLGTVGQRSYIPADLSDSAQVTLTINFNGGYEPPFTSQLLGTYTNTFPSLPGEATPASYASANSFVLSRTMPSQANGELMQMQVVISFGDAGVFTKAT